MGLAFPPPGRGPRIVRVAYRTLAAVDLGPRSDAVLRARLVVAAQARVTVLHAYQAPFEAKLRYKRFPEEDFLRYAEIASETAQRDMDALLADPN